MEHVCSPASIQLQKLNTNKANRTNNDIDIPPAIALYAVIELCSACDRDHVCTRSPNDDQARSNGEWYMVGSAAAGRRALLVLHPGLIRVAPYLSITCSEPLCPPRVTYSLICHQDPISVARNLLMSKLVTSRSFPKGRTGLGLD